MSGAGWIWWIPALPFAGATVNGLWSLARRWKPGEPDAGHGRAPAPRRPSALGFVDAGNHPPTGSARDVEPVGPSQGKHDEHAAHHEPSPVNGWIACLAMLAAFVIACVAFTTMLKSPDGALATADAGSGYAWIVAGEHVRILARLVVDHLSGVLLLIVTGVGFLIHLYSVGYMAHDENQDRYFTYLNLFAGMMLMLILGDSLPILFVGWEGVGLCSYLLIGFWYTDVAKAKAGKKAFVVNRVGDFGFLLGMLILFAATVTRGGDLSGGGTLSFVQLANVVAASPHAWMVAAALLLFVGATGKSAQFPLYIWLPDAMAGPTPVSALIHAATMVTAGVYMIARMSFLFANPEVVGMVPAIVICSVGAFTAFFAASIALVQNDIKKVLAYSTVSQLGYMVLAVGAGGTAAAVFHLTTHAFFKALLFLGAGAVIHAMEHAGPDGADPNDIRRMGGLRKRMPWTFWTFVAGWAAIVAFPFTSGFCSKDAVLEAVMESGLLPPGLRWTLFIVALVAAALTAFYMTRLVLLVFLGESRLTSAQQEKIADGGVTMTLPLVVLGVLSIVAGVVLWIPGTGHRGFQIFLEPMLLLEHQGMVSGGLRVEGPPGLLTMFLGFVAFAAGTGAAWYLYVTRPELPSRLAARFHGTYRALVAKYWVDQAIEAAIVDPGYHASRDLLWQDVDAGVIDGLVNGSGTIARAGASWLSRLQSGLVQNYAVGITFGIAAIGVYLISRLLWA